MAITIDLLDLGSVEVPKAALARAGGTDTATSYVQAFLIRGAGDAPIVVDAGYRDDAAMAAAGAPMPPLREDQTLVAQLARFGIEPADVGMVIMTHLHVDHAGQIDRFPMSTPVVLQRREVEVAVAGSHGHAFGLVSEVYPKADIQHVFDRVYEPGALAMLDLELSGPVELAPGVAVEHAGGHTAGSLCVRVETDEGVANICGDLVYNVEAALIDRVGKVDAFEPSLSQSVTGREPEEYAALRRATSRARFLLPGHDRPAVLDHGRVVGRIEGTTVPGPVTGLN